MSEYVDYKWRLEKEKRRKAYLKRVRKTTTGYQTKYTNLLSDLVRQRLDEYLPDEFAQMRSDLAKLDSLLKNNPEGARELSKQIGTKVSGLPAMARSAKSDFEIRERQRQKELAEMRRQATSELEQYLLSLIVEIKDPIEQDYAFDGLKAIQSEYSGMVIEAVELTRIKEELRLRMNAIQVDASTKASAWKVLKAHEAEDQSQQALIDMHREEVVSSSNSNDKTVQAMLASLDDIQQQITQDQCSMDDLQKRLSAVTDKNDTAVVDEECRRMAVVSIVTSLEKAGFVVLTPKRSGGEKDEVIITARKPSGSEASFRVTSDGSMIYKFDNYEGMKCKTDIDRVLPMLQDIYGIELSDKRVLSQNPERITKSAKPIEDGNKRHRHD